MHGLIALQVAFCVLVLFAAGLFAGTLQHLSQRPLGFAADRLLTVQAITERAVEAQRQADLLLREVDALAQRRGVDFRLVVPEGPRPKQNSVKE